MNKILYPQNIFRIYGVSFVRIWERMDCVTALHCILIHASLKFVSGPSIVNKPALVQIMTRCRAADKISDKLSEEIKV